MSNIVLPDISNDSIFSGKQLTPTYNFFVSKNKIGIPLGTIRL